MTEKINSGVKGMFNKIGNWYNVILIVAVIGTGIGNYMVSNYRHDEHDKNYAELNGRVKNLEGVNYELLLQQLENIQDANTKLNDKIDKTNERVDKVLEILLSK